MDGQIAEPAPPGVWCLDFNDPFGMALAQREAAIEYLALSHEDYRSALTAVDFGAFSIQFAQDGAHLVRGAVRGDRTILLMSSGPAPGATVNGWAVDERGAAILAPGASLLCNVPAPVEWIAYSVDDAKMRSWLDSADLPRAGDFTIAEALQSRTPALRRLAAEMAALARRDRSALANGAITRAVEDSVHRALERGLLPQHGQLRTLRQRVRVVAQAEAYLDAHVGKTVYTQDLVAALGVPARSISSAFASVYGMGPHQFLQLRRLNMVHWALQRAEGDARLVKTVALDHGFWHLGRFAQHYKRLFGEAPSATLARRETRPWFGYRGPAGTA